MGFSCSAHKVWCMHAFKVIKDDKTFFDVLQYFLSKTLNNSFNHTYNKILDRGWFAVHMLSARDRV